MDPVNAPAKLEVRRPVPEIIGIEVLGGIANPQSWGRGGRLQTLL